MVVKAEEFCPRSDVAGKTPPGRRPSRRRQCAADFPGVKAHGGKQHLSSKSNIGLGCLRRRPDQTG